MGDIEWFGWEPGLTVLDFCVWGDFFPVYGGLLELCNKMIKDQFRAENIMIGQFCYQWGTIMYIKP